MTYREKIKAELLRLRESSLEYGQTKEQRIFVDTGKDLVLAYLERFIDCLYEEQKPHNPKVREVTGKLRELLNNMDEEELEKTCKKMEEEAAASEYSFGVPSEIFDILPISLQNIWKREIEVAFKDGAQWMKKQMMKKNKED